MVTLNDMAAQRITYELGYISGVIEGADAAIFVKEQIQGAAARILEEIRDKVAADHEEAK